MQKWFNKKAKIILKAGIIVSVFCLLVSNVDAYWSTTTTYGTKSAQLSGTIQNQSTTITLPAGAVAYFAQTDNGSATYSQTGSTVTVNVTGGTSSASSSQVWNPTKYSKDVTVTSGPQSSQSFSSTYNYNDGSYSGTISQSGSAILMGGLPSDSKTMNYSQSFYSSVTGTYKGSYWYFVCDYSLPRYYYYGSDSGGYSGTLYYQKYQWCGGDTYSYPPNPYVGQQIHSLTDVQIIFFYSGTITRPDTQTWDMKYAGTVYMGGYDTVSITSYTYNVTIYYSLVTTAWINDTTPPDGSATLNPSSITTGNVVISFTATGTGSGVKLITLPDGTVVNSTTATYTATDDGTYNFTVLDNDGNSKTVPVTVSNIDRTITVEHPVSIDYAINPNNSNPFICPDITITNNSRIKVQVSIQQLKAAPGGSILFNDVPPSKYNDWSRLTVSQTKPDIAMGVRVKETTTGNSTWYSISNPNTLYAANITSKTLLGVLNPNGAYGNLSLSAYCGLAWNASFTAKHSLILVFDAY